MSGPAYLELDGALGEGGGQVLRTALTLAACSGRAVHLRHIRAGRSRPGLRRQHLTAVQAVACVTRAQVRGDRLGSQELYFAPGPVQGGDYHFAVGTAGSVSLVLQSVLYPLLFAPQASRLTLEGGTHNPLAPPFEFLEQAFLPLLKRMGAQVEVRLERHGFYPTGGGRLQVAITPIRRLDPLEATARGALVERRARALIAGIPAHVAERELQRVKKRLGWREQELELCPLPSDQGPGNVLLLSLRHAQAGEVCAAFARKGVRAEQVADEAIVQARRYLDTDVAAGEHLADQLLLPLALAGAGRFTTLAPSRHTLTNIEVLRAFLPVRFELRELGQGRWQIAATSPA